MNQSSNRKLIILIRHGERADDTQLHNATPTLHPYDPELTSKGIKQAVSIGNQLKSLLIEKSLISKKILLYSSPFARTLMTSLGLLEGLEIEQTGNVKIKIDYALFEFMNERSFKFNPEEILEYKKLYDKNVSTETKMFLKDLLNYEHEVIQEIKVNFPENIHNLVARCNKITSNIKEKLINSEADVAIIVTHGYGVQVIAEDLSSSSELFLVDYCSTYIFEIDGIGNSQYVKEIYPCL